MCFIGQKSIFRYYCIQNFKDGIQIQVYNINNECVTHSSQFISEKVKRNFKIFQAQFREKIRKLRLRQNYGFLIKKACSIETHSNKILDYSSIPNYRRTRIYGG